jgi:hypothetical protein
MSSQRIPDTKMTLHEEFLSEDFVLYAAECKRMASLARPSQGNAMTIAMTLPDLPKWSDLLTRVAARYGQAHGSYSGMGGRVAYS